MRAEVHPVALHDRVERPHVDKVEKLGEELDGERGVDPALPEQEEMLILSGLFEKIKPEQTHRRAENTDDPCCALLTLLILQSGKVGIAWHDL